MKKLIPILVILILLIPEGKKEVDKFFLYASEGMVAVHMCLVDEATPTPNPEPTPDKKYKCDRCKDTGIIKPDGRVEIPCPDCRVPKKSGCDCINKCGKENCNCQSTEMRTSTTPQNIINITKSKEEVVKLTRRVVLFTQPDICAPCRQYDNVVVPALKKKGITIGDKDTNDIQVLDPTRPVEHPLWKKYGGQSIPFFLAFEGDKLISTEIGYITEEQTLKLLGK